MVCVYCGHETAVTNSRPQKRLNQVWRRRRCSECRAIVTTIESVDYSAAWMVKRPTGQLQPFSRDKLFVSLYNSLQHRKSATSDATALTATVIRSLALVQARSTLEPAMIRSAASVALHRFDIAAATHYDAFHSSGR